MAQIKPNINDEDIIKCLQDSYELHVDAIAFFPVGADFNTAIYRVLTKERKDYFLKLRRSNAFNEASVRIPRYLADREFKAVIPPIITVAGDLWTNIESYKAILYPYVTGHNAGETPLTPKQWLQFGNAVKQLHNTTFPPALINDVPQETFSSQWRDKVEKFLHYYIKKGDLKEAVEIKAVLFLKSKYKEIIELIDHAEKLACILKNQQLEYVLCHADIHGYNLLINKKGTIFIVDWDTLIFAPKERDLMFIGAGVTNSGLESLEEELLFYRGYLDALINQDAICYYRYERIIQDIGEYCEHIFYSDGKEEDKLQSLEYLKSNFLPDGTIERAHWLYKIIRPQQKNLQ